MPLQRQICTPALPSKCGRRSEELIATSGGLTLVTNCAPSRLWLARPRIRFCAGWFLLQSCNQGFIVCE